MLQFPIQNNFIEFFHLLLLNILFNKKRKFSTKLTGFSMSINIEQNKHFPEGSHLGRMSQSDQIQPFEIKPDSLTHQQVTKLIQKWDTFGRIHQKFGIWGFNFNSQKVMKIVPKQFYKTAIHYVFLKKLAILIRGFDQNQVLNSSILLKNIYKEQSIAGKVKGRKFDYLLLVTVKLIGFFLGSHTRQIIIKKQLQAQIYAILIFVLLGTQVGETTFSVVQQKYKQKPALKFNRSQELLLKNLQNKKYSEHKLNASKPIAMSKKRIARCDLRSGSALFQQIQLQKEQPDYREIKQILKSNLFVKQFVPKPQPKQSLEQVLIKANRSNARLKQLGEAKQIQKKEMKHKRIYYTQMSSSLDLGRNSQSLNSLRNHHLKVNPQKNSKYYQMVTKEDIGAGAADSKQMNDLKLPRIQNIKQHQVSSYQIMGNKKIKTNYWKSVIEQMKQNRTCDIQHFQAIGTKVYFKNGEFDDENRKSKLMDGSQISAQKESVIQNNCNLEFLTQKVYTYPTLRQLEKVQQRKYIKSQKQSLKASNSSIKTKTLLQQLRSQINILECSTFADQKQIYKQQKGFLKIYSNQPLDDLNKKIKKLSSHQLKEKEKMFQQQCKIRSENVQKTDFNIVIDSVGQNAIQDA